MNDSITALYNILIEGRYAEWASKKKVHWSWFIQRPKQNLWKRGFRLPPCAISSKPQAWPQGRFTVITAERKSCLQLWWSYPNIWWAVPADPWIFWKPAHGKQPEQIGKMSSECMYELLGFSCEHMDEFYLILKCSEGTKYASMINDMVELEVESTHKYYKVLEQPGLWFLRLMKGWSILWRREW